MGSELSVSTYTFPELLVSETVKSLHGAVSPVVIVFVDELVIAAFISSIEPLEIALVFNAIVKLTPPILFEAI